MKIAILIGHLVFLVMGCLSALGAMLTQSLSLAYTLIIMSILYFLFHIAMNTERVD